MVADAYSNGVRLLYLTDFAEQSAVMFLLLSLFLFIFLFLFLIMFIFLFIFFFLIMGGWVGWLDRLSHRRVFRISVV